MKTDVKKPIRRKILFLLMLAVTTVVSLITFTMANFFHDDKQAYINDWVSIAAVSSADECQALIEDYKQRLELYARIMLNESMDHDDKVALLEHQFDELPELVEIVLYRQDEEVELAVDVNSLAESNLTDADLRDYRAANPLPIESLVAGDILVRNATLSSKMPSFQLAFSSTTGSSGDSDPPLLISAIMRSDDLARLGSRFAVFEIRIVGTDGVLLMHPDIGRVVGHEAADLQPQASRIHSGDQSGLTLEYERGDTEMIAGYAAVDYGAITVAAEIPKSAAYLASRELLNRLMLVAIALLVAVSIGGLLWARGITRPVETLSRATGQIARGDFDVKVDVGSEDEIGSLANSFNTMTSELKARDEALSEAHQQLIQSEKLAAFGQLGAGIAHEVKNPLAGVLGCAQLSLLDAEPGSEIYENLTLIEKETKRCKEIIEHLMKFARQEKTLLEPTEVNPVVRDAIAIVNHQMELNRVKVRCDLSPDLPLIHGNGNQLQQVLINLMINAQQAMDGEPGTLQVSTRQVDGNVELVVRDDGPGIPEDIQARLFDPFFTTKPAGKGTGLGLSVSYGIIQDHAGEIMIDSQPGEGATFVISIPVLTLQPEEFAGKFETDMAMV